MLELEDGTQLDTDVESVELLEVFREAGLKSLKFEFGNRIEVGGVYLAYVGNLRWVDSELEVYNPLELWELLRVVHWRFSKVFPEIFSEGCSIIEGWFKSSGLSVSCHELKNGVLINAGEFSQKYVLEKAPFEEWEFEKYAVLECTGDPIEEVKSWLEIRGLDWSVSFNEETGELVVHDGLDWSDVTQLEKQWCLF